MKKYLLALIAVLGMVSAGQAQRTELSLSYGGYTQMDAMDCHDGGGDVNNAWGALNIGANVNVAPNFWIGPSYTFSSTSRKGNNENHFYYHVIMLNGMYDYYRNSIVKMYAHCGIGAIISHQTWHGESENRGYFGFQINPICAKVDLSRQISMFGELGFGAQGLLQVGFKIAL